MHLTELTEDERRILLWLLATLTDIDDDIDDGELEELHYVGSVLEIDLVPELRAALSHYGDAEEAMQHARVAVRPAARDTIRQVLDELSTSDGVRLPEERELLDALEAAWA